MRTMLYSLSELQSIIERERHICNRLMQQNSEATDDNERIETAMMYIEHDEILKYATYVFEFHVTKN